MACLADNNNTNSSIFSKLTPTKRLTPRAFFSGVIVATTVIFASSTLANDTQSLRQALDALNLENQQLRDTKALLESQLVKQEALLEKNARRIHTLKNSIAVLEGTPTESFTHDAQALRAKATEQSSTQNTP